MRSAVSQLRERVTRGDLIAWGVSLAAGLLLVLFARARGESAWIIQNGGSVDNLRAARLLLFVVTVLLVRGGIALVPRMNKPRWAFLGVWTVYLGFWVVVSWPGQVMYSDTVQMVFETRQLINSGWYSWLYSLGFIALWDIAQALWLVTIVQAALMVAAGAYAADVIRRRGGKNWPAILVTVLLMLSAPLLVNTMLVTRDAIFGPLHLILALLIYDAVAVRRRASLPLVLGVFALSAVLSQLRGDGIVLLFAPLLLLLLRPARAQVLRAGGAYVAIAVTFLVLLPSLAVVSQVPHRYELSLRIGALAAILDADASARAVGPNAGERAAVGGTLDDPPVLRESTKNYRKDLAPVLDPDRLARLSTFSEIPAFWLQAWNLEGVTDEQWARFTKVTDQLIKDNFGIVLAARLRTFLAASGMGPGAGPYAPGVPARERFTSIPPGQEIGIVGNSPFPGLLDDLQKPLVDSSEYRGLKLSGSLVFWNLIPALILLLAPFVVRGRIRWEMVFAGVILARVPLVFLAAPSSQFKYYYSLYLGGIVVLGLIIASVIASRTASDGTPELQTEEPEPVPSAA